MRDGRHHMNDHIIDFILLESSRKLRFFSTTTRQVVNLAHEYRFLTVEDEVLY